MNRNLRDINFLALGDGVIAGLEDVDVALQAIHLKQEVPGHNVSMRPEIKQDSMEPTLNTLEMHTTDPTFLPTVAENFVCSFQYNSEVEFERILHWAHNSSGNILQLSKKRVEIAHDLEVEQMQKLSELRNWRQALFSKENSES